MFIVNESEVSKLNVEEVAKKLIEEIEDLKFRVKALENPKVDMPETDITGRRIQK